MNVAVEYLRKAADEQEREAGRLRDVAKGIAEQLAEIRQESDGCEQVATQLRAAADLLDGSNIGRPPAPRR